MVHIHEAVQRKNLRAGHQAGLPRTADFFVPEKHTDRFKRFHQKLAEEDYAQPCG